MIRNIGDFAHEHGIAAIVRRHFAYRQPASNADLGGYSVRGALTYSGNLDDRDLGLTFAESVKAYEQGNTLVVLGCTPGMIITGSHQRNRDGGRVTADGIFVAGGPEVLVTSSPAVTMPTYPSISETRKALEEYDDYAVHAYLAGKLDRRLWSESPQTFSTRVESAVADDYGVDGPVLFDLNFEALVLLYHRHVLGFTLGMISRDKSGWCPKNGGGLVYSLDRKIVREFAPDLNIVRLPAWVDSTL